MTMPTLPSPACVLAIAIGAAAAPAAAQRADSTHHVLQSAHHATAKHVTGTKAMRAEARIGEDSATAIALAQVSGGKVRSGELEREHGKLIYSFDITVAGKPGVEEVNVDALDGSIVAHEHEGPMAEAKEARREAKEKPTAKKP